MKAKSKVILMLDMDAAWIEFAGSIVGAFLAGGIALRVMYVTTRQTRDIQDEIKNDAVMPVLIFCDQSYSVTKYAVEDDSGIIIHGIENIGNGFAKDIDVLIVNHTNRLDVLHSGMALKRGEKTEILTIISDEYRNLARNDKLEIRISYANIYGKGYTTKYYGIFDGELLKVDKITFENHDQKALAKLILKHREEHNLQKPEVRVTECQKYNQRPSLGQ